MVRSIPLPVAASLPPRDWENLLPMKKVLSKAEIVRRIEKASEAEDVFPGVLGMLGNPVTFAARWGLPLSRNYLKFKERELRAANRRCRASATRRNGNGASHSRRRKTVAA